MQLLEGFDRDRTVTITALTLAHQLRALLTASGSLCGLTPLAPRSKSLGIWPHCRPSWSPWDAELKALKCTVTSKSICEAAAFSYVRAWGALACGAYLLGKCSVQTHCWARVILRPIAVRLQAAAGSRQSA